GVAGSRRVLTALVLVAVPLWTALTWRQVGFWKDDPTLFCTFARDMPENFLAHHVLGCAHLREHRLDEAMAEFREALRLRPTYAEAHSNMGMALELSGNSAGAIAQYEAALQLSPRFATAHFNLGRLLAIQGHPNGAMEHFEAAVRSDPDLVEAQANL